MLFTEVTARVGVKLSKKLFDLNLFEVKEMMAAVVAIIWAIKPSAVHQTYQLRKKNVVGFLITMGQKSLVHQVFYKQPNSTISYGPYVLICILISG